MRQLIICFVLFLSFSTVSSCKKKDNKEIESDYLTKVVKDLHIANNINWIVILPGGGCAGCIDEGEGFFKENVKNKKFYFVLTSIHSLKILKAKVGFDFISFSNVYIDKEDIIHIPTTNIIYPCIIYLEKGEFKYHEFQCPENVQAFSNLKEKIKQQ